MDDFFPVQSSPVQSTRFRKKNAEIIFMFWQKVNPKVAGWCRLQEATILKVRNVSHTTNTGIRKGGILRKPPYLPQYPIFHNIPL
jgi:hypothetical protein